MKDEHDKRTLELVEAATPAGARPHGRIPAGVASIQIVKPAPALKSQDALYVAEQRAKQQMESWLPATLVAHSFGVTPRRIRFLLSSGRLVGRQLENGYWEVSYPYRYVMGRRGPKLQMQRPKEVKKVELRAV